MDRQPRIEELLNKIIFLRKALEYYGANNTYACKSGIAPIDKDRGHQARFALEQTESIDEYNKGLIEEYKKAVEEEKERFEEGFKGDSSERMVNLQKIINEVYEKLNKYGNKNV